MQSVIKTGKPDSNGRSEGAGVTGSSDSSSTGRCAAAVVSKPGHSWFRWCEAHSDRLSRVGFVCVIISYASIAAMGLRQTGQWDHVYGAVSGFSNDLAVGAGLEVQKVTVEGQVNISDGDIATALGTRSGISIFAFDTAAARERLRKVGWVREARVMRLLPATLVVELEEKAPYALWHEGGQTAVIGASGEILALADRSKFPNLPVVSGPGAAQPSREIIDALKLFPELMRHVAEMERIAGRRWDVVLNTGLRAKLPALNIRQALVDLNALATKNPAALSELAEIDFRLPSQFTVRLKDGSDKGRKNFMSWLSKTKGTRDNQL